MITKMSYKQLAKELLKLKTNEVLTFASECVDENKPNLCDDDCSGWYYAKRLDIEDYDSHFIVIDYCGGGMTFAVPINDEELFVDLLAQNLFIFRDYIGPDSIYVSDAERDKYNYIKEENKYWYTVETWNEYGEVETSNLFNSLEEANKMYDTLVKTNKYVRIIRENEDVYPIEEIKSSWN